MISFCSCAAKRVYNVPEYIKTSHAEEMAKFNSKKDVLMHFGAPDKIASIDSIEVIEYQMGQITSTKTKSVFVGNGQAIRGNSEFNLSFSGTLMRNENPYYNPRSMNNVSNVVLSQYITSSMSNSSSETILKYAKFWIINGEVMKWETQGINLGKDTPNPSFNPDEKKKIEEEELQYPHPPLWQILIFAGGGVLMLVIL